MPENKSINKKNKMSNKFEEQINLENVNIKENREALTDLQEYNISSTIVKLLGDIRKYMLLTQLQIDLQHKPHQVQPIMREVYQFEEMKLIMDIRTDLDMFYAFTKDNVIINNVDAIRNKFESAINYLTTNMMNVKSVLDKNYIEILDEFLDKLKMLANDIATKSIYEENFRLQ